MAFDKLTIFFTYALISLFSLLVDEGNKDLPFFHLKEELRVTPQDNDAYIWSGAKTAVRVHPNGTMFVIDPGEQRVVVIDQNGALLHIIGGRGQGPGEFESLRNFQILADSRLLAFENLQAVSQISYFDPSFSFLQRTRLLAPGMSLRDVTFSHDGNHLFSLATEPLVEDNQEKNSYFILDKNLVVQHEISTLSLPSFDSTQIDDANYWAKYLTPRFALTAKGLTGYAAFDHLGNIYTAIARDYAITKWNSDMTKIAVFNASPNKHIWSNTELEAMVESSQAKISAQLPARLQPIVTRSVVRTAIEKADFPPRMHPIGGLHTFPDGKLLVVTYQSMVTGKGQADVWTSSGKRIGRLKLPRYGLEKLALTNTHLYCLEQMDTGELHLVRYQLGRDSL